MRSSLSFLIIAFSLLVAGCGTPPERRLDSPSIRVTELTETGGNYALAVRFINTNTVPLVINRSDYTLTFGDTRIGRFTDRNAVGVPALGKVVQPVPVPATLSSAVRAFLSKNPGEIRITLESSLELDLRDDDTLTLKSTGSSMVKP